MGVERSISWVNVRGQWSGGLRESSMPDDGISEELLMDFANVERSDKQLYVCG